MNAALLSSPCALDRLRSVSKNHPDADQSFAATHTRSLRAYSLSTDCYADGHVGVPFQSADIPSGEGRCRRRLVSSIGASVRAQFTLATSSGPAAGTSDEPHHIPSECAATAHCSLGGGLALLTLASTANPPSALSDSRAVQAGEQTADDAAEHAAEDLATTPIDQIERRPRPTPTASSTRRGAGRAPPHAARRPRRSASTRGYPGSGARSSTRKLVPVFEAVLPDGKVLMWDSVGDNAAETYPDQTFTRAQVWNPADDTYKRVDVQGYNIFCAGFTHLENGNVLVAGGNKDTSRRGIVQTHIFNWRTEHGRGSGHGRRPVVPVRGGDGQRRGHIAGGGPVTDEVYQTTADPPAEQCREQYLRGPAYPFMNSRPDTHSACTAVRPAEHPVTSGNGAVTG